MAFNEQAIRADVRRYRKASVTVAGVTYELTGTVRQLYRLDMLKPGAYGSARVFVAAFSTLESVFEYLAGVVEFLEAR